MYLFEDESNSCKKKYIYKIFGEIREDCIFQQRISDKIRVARERERNFRGRVDPRKVIRNRCWHCSIMYSRALRVALQNARNLRLISILKHLRLYAYWRDCSRTTRPFLAPAIICRDITRIPTIFARITRVLSLLHFPFSLHPSIFIIYPSSLPSSTFIFLSIRVTSWNWNIYICIKRQDWSEDSTRFKIFSFILAPSSDCELFQIDRMKS